MAALIQDLAREVIDKLSAVDLIDLALKRTQSHHECTELATYMQGRVETRIDEHALHAVKTGSQVPIASLQSDKTYVLRMQKYAHRVVHVPIRFDDVRRVYGGKTRRASYSVHASYVLETRTDGTIYVIEADRFGLYDFD